MQKPMTRILFAIGVGIAVGAAAGTVVGLMGYPGWIIGPIVGIAAPILFLATQRQRES